MSFEHRHQPVLPQHKWLQRVARSIWLAMILVVAALAVGVLGYHEIGDLPWIDAFLEAAMILGGMGAIAPMHNDAIKIFAACYALFSGLVIITTTGVILAPWLHRLLHQFHAHNKPHDAD